MKHFPIRLLAIIISCAMLASCQFPANISTGKEMNQNAENITLLAQCPGTPNCVCSSYPNTKEHIEPIRYNGDAGDAIARMEKVIAGMTRSKITSSSDRYIHAEFTSLIFRFVDDLEILVDTENSVLQVRSASRVGKSDLGVNRKRVEQLRLLFQQS